MLNARPSSWYDVVEGTRTEADAPLRHGGLDQGSVMDEHKVFGTLIRSVPNGECNVDDSQCMTEVLPPGQESELAKHPPAASRRPLPIEEGVALGASTLRCLLVLDLR